MALLDLFRRSADGEAIRVKNIFASRAVYVGEDLPERVEIKIKVEDGQTLILDMNVKQCATLISQLTSAHNAISPPLRPDLRGSW